LFEIKRIGLYHYTTLFFFFQYPFRNLFASRVGGKNFLNNFSAKKGFCCFFAYFNIGKGKKGERL